MKKTILLLSLMPLFATAQNFVKDTVQLVSVRAQDIDAVDMNGDGIQEIATVSAVSGDRVYLYSGVTDSTFQEELSQFVDDPNAVRIVDLNGNDTLDLVVTSNDGDAVIWYKNDGNFGFTSQNIVNGLDQVRWMDVADVNGDNHMDLVVSAGIVPGSIVNLYINDGSENFTEVELSGESEGIPQVKFGYVNSDNFIDIVVARQTGGFWPANLSWYENNGSGSFTERFISSDYDGIFNVDIADIDGDNENDILFGDLYGDQLVYMKNGGNAASFTEVVIDPTIVGPNAARAIDANGDGKMDVAIVTDDGSGGSDNDFMILYYQEIGGWSTDTLDKNFDQGQQLIVSDVNSDGMDDIVVTHEKGLFVFRNIQTPMVTSLEFEDLEGIEVYPNPANEALFIGEANSVELFDVMGVNQGTFEVVDGMINVAHVHSGVYSIRINSHEIRTERIVIKH